MRASVSDYEVHGLLSWAFWLSSSMMIKNAQHVIVQRLISVVDRKPGPGQCPKEIKNQELLMKMFYHAAHHVIPLAKNNMMGGGY